MSPFNFIFILVNFILVLHHCELFLFSFFINIFVAYNILLISGIHCSDLIFIYYEMIPMVSLVAIYHHAKLL